MLAGSSRASTTHTHGWRPAVATSARHRVAARTRRPHARGRRKHQSRKRIARSHDRSGVRVATVNRSQSQTVASNPPPALHFGIYPWAAPGAVNPADPQVPDDPAKALAAVRTLQGTHSFTVHLYGQYTGTNGADADALVSDATWWSENGVKVEMVLRYRPAAPDLAAGYIPWVQAVATRLAALPGLADLQIGNEPNTSAAAAGDGAYPGVINAIAQGVPAARAALLAAGRPDVRVGFNWAAGESPCATGPMWSQLRAAGGRAFESSVGFVGIDVYPGTWSPPLQSSNPTASQIDATVVSSLRCLRTRHMVAAGLPASVAITVAETGFPTDANRSEATQTAVLQQTIASVQSVSRTYGVTDLRWFSLRDANTASGQLENGYGLLHDDYSPKPAFSAYQQIIAADGA